MGFPPRFEPAQNFEAAVGHRVLVNAFGQVDVEKHQVETAFLQFLLGLEDTAREGERTLGHARGCEEDLGEDAALLLFIVDDQNRNHLRLPGNAVTISTSLPIQSDEDWA